MAPRRSPPSPGLAVDDRRRRTPTSSPRRRSSTRASRGTRSLGAAGYEVEVNFSSDWAESSKVCCDPIKGQHLHARDLPLARGGPRQQHVLLARAGDRPRATTRASGTTARPSRRPSTTCRRSRPRASRTCACATTSATRRSTPTPAPPSSTPPCPIVPWDPVPGASSYQVNVTEYRAVPATGRRQSGRTPRRPCTAWTPLGWNRPAGDPYATSISIANDFNSRLDAGASVLRARAGGRSGLSTVRRCVRLRRLDLPPGAQPGRLPVDRAARLDVVQPLRDARLGVQRAAHRHVARTDAALHLGRGSRRRELLRARLARPELHDHRRLRLHAHPCLRTPAQPVAVDRLRGRDDPLLLGRPPGRQRRTAAACPRTRSRATRRASASSRRRRRSRARSTTRRSTRPATEFQWSPVLGARRYRLQVAQNPTFSNPIDDVVTDSTAYTSNTTYPSDTTLYWRVRADAENGTSTMVGLTWSRGRDVQEAAAQAGARPGQPDERVAPADDPLERRCRAQSPTTSTSSSPTATTSTFTNIPAPAGTFTKMTGVGVATWQVRANFPTDSSAVVHGPYSLPGTFTHTIPQPANPAEEAGDRRLLFSWDPRPRADHYRVQVSTRADFLTTVENVNTQTTAYAPLLTSGAYTAGGTFYWRVAVVDTDTNTGDFTAAHSFTLPADHGSGRRRRPDHPDVQGPLDRLSREEEDEDDHAHRAQRRASSRSRPRTCASPAPASTAVTKQTSASGEVTLQGAREALSGHGDLQDHQGRLRDRDLQADCPAGLGPARKPSVRRYPGLRATTATSMRAPDGSAAISTVARAGYGSRRWRA